MKWLAGIAILVLAVIGYLYYDEYGLPTRIEEFLEDLAPREEGTPVPLRTPARDAPAATSTPRDADSSPAPTATPQPAAATAAPTVASPAPTPTLRPGVPTPTPTTVPLPAPPTPTPAPTVDPSVEVRCSQADERSDIGNEDQWYTTLEECLQYGNWYRIRGNGGWKSTMPTPTPTPLLIKPEDSRMGLNPDGKAVWTFVVNGVTVYCNIGELQGPCAQRLGLSGVY